MGLHPAWDFFAPLHCEHSVPSMAAAWYFRPIDQVIFLTRYFIMCLALVSGCNSFQQNDMPLPHQRRCNETWLIRKVTWHIKNKSSCLVIWGANKGKGIVLFMSRKCPWIIQYAQTPGDEASKANTLFLWTLLNQTSLYSKIHFFFYQKLYFINRPTSQTHFQVWKQNSECILSRLGYYKKQSVSENWSFPADFSHRTSIFWSSRPPCPAQTKGRKTLLISRAEPLVQLLLYWAGD